MITKEHAMMCVSPPERQPSEQKVLIEQFESVHEAVMTLGPSRALELLNIQWKTEQLHLLRRLALRTSKGANQ